MKNELISIIVPVYNVELYLARCIESLISQTYNNLEIILVDDGSTDSSGKICDEYAERDSRIHVFHVKNGGVSQARNLALDTFKGEWFSFVDSDDFVSEYYIEHLINAAMSKDVKIATCKTHVTNNPNICQMPSVINEIPQILDAERYDFGSYYSHPQVWGAVYHRSVLQETRFQMDLYCGEDTLFFAELLHKVYSFCFLDEKLYCYVQYPISSYHGEYDEKKYTEIVAWERVCKLFRGTKVYPSCRVALGFTAMWGVYRLFENASMDKKKYHQLLKKMRKSIWYVLRSNQVVNQKIMYLFFSIFPAMCYRVLKNKERKKNA